MKCIRFKIQNQIHYGILEDDVIKECVNFSLPIQQTGRIFKISNIELLIPIQPSKIIGIGLNYRKHALEFGLPIPQQPIVFIKPDTCLISSHQSVVLPSLSNQVEYEGEIGVVISKKCKNVSKAQAKDVILGIIATNDLTARDLQPKQGQWTLAKSFDGFLPVGDWIETEFDINDIPVSTFLNQKLVQQSNANDMIFSIEEIIAFVSQYMTLHEGDLICTGTPSGVGPVKSKDIVTVSVGSHNQVVTTFSD